MYEFITHKSGGKPYLSFAIILGNLIIVFKFMK